MAELERDSSAGSSICKGPGTGGKSEFFHHSVLFCPSVLLSSLARLAFLTAHLLGCDQGGSLRLHDILAQLPKANIVSSQCPDFISWEQSLSDLARCHPGPVGLGVPDSSKTT